MKAIQTTNNQGGKLSSKFHFRNNNYIKHSRNLNRTGLLSAFTFLLLALTCLFPISKGEQNTEAVTGTVQSSSLTLNVSKSAASVELDVNSNTGTFASSTTDNSANFSVTTNNFSGYTLTISGNDDEGKLYDSTKQNFLTSLANATSETDFSSTSNTNLNGQWGYKPSKFNSIANNNYLPAPTTTASTLDTTSVANPTANNYSISLGLRADYTTTADTYSNSFIITAVPNPIAYVITYDANTTDTVSNMPASQNSTTSATEITLSDKTPAREGYDFKGWCTTAPTTANPDTCTGTTFQPGDTYGIDQTSENITVLYAIWEEQIAGYIQDYTYARCSNEAASKAVKLMDKRDDKVYTVRYINGLCTMTQNLAIDKGQLLTPEDSNVKESWTMTSIDLEVGDNSFDVAEMHQGNEEQIAKGYGNWYNYCAATAGTICDSSNITNATYDICPKGWRLPTLAEQTSISGTSQGSWSTVNQTAFNAVAAGRYGSGSLYDSGTDGNWWSSTARNTTNRYNLYYSTSIGLLSGGDYNRNRGFSVRCVKAKPGVTISFNANGGTGTMNMQKIDAGQSANLTANTFTRTDYVFTGWNTKADGSGTSYADTALYAAPVSEDNKIVVLYAQWMPAMQNYTLAQCQSDAAEAPVTVIDKRDNNSYTVRYINGNCWMTQNLRIGSGVRLTHEDSNIAAEATFTVTSTDMAVSFTEAKAYDSGNIDYGYYYNYCAATAGTICTDSDSTEAIYDICPSGWHIPNKTQAQTIGTNSSTNVAAFSPVYSGHYYNNKASDIGSYGEWWLSTASSLAANRYFLYYYSGDLYYNPADYSRKYGLPIRCIRSN